MGKEEQGWERAGNSWKKKGMGLGIPGMGLGLGWEFLGLGMSEILGRATELPRVPGIRGIFGIRGTSLDEIPHSQPFQVGIPAREKEGKEEKGGKRRKRRKSHAGPIPGEFPRKAIPAPGSASPFWDQPGGPKSRSRHVQEDPGWEKRPEFPAGSAGRRGRLRSFPAHSRLEFCPERRPQLRPRRERSQKIPSGRQGGDLGRECGIWDFGWGWAVMDAGGAGNHPKKSPRGSEEGNRDGGLGKWDLG